MKNLNDSDADIERFILLGKAVSLLRRASHGAYAERLFNDLIDLRPHSDDETVGMTLDTVTVGRTAQLFGLKLNVNNSSQQWHQPGQEVRRLELNSITISVQDPERLVAFLDSVTPDASEYRNVRRAITQLMITPQATLAHAHSILDVCGPCPEFTKAATDAALLGAAFERLEIPCEKVDYMKRLAVTSHPKEFRLAHQTGVYEPVVKGRSLLGMQIMDNGPDGYDTDRYIGRDLDQLGQMIDNLRTDESAQVFLDELTTRTACHLAVAESIFNRRAGPRAQNRNLPYAQGLQRLTINVEAANPGVMQRARQQLLNANVHTTGPSLG